MLIFVDDVCVYKESDKEWCRPFNGIRENKKKVSVTDGKMTTSELSQVLPIAAANNDRDLKRLLSSVNRDMHGSVPGIPLIEMLSPSDT